MHAFRGVVSKSHLPPLFSSSSSSSSSSIGPKTAFVRFQQAKTGSESNQGKNMDKPQNQKNGDAMSHSFGEGYSTRSDEEGFGGTCGGSQQCLPNKHAPDLDPAATNVVQDNKGSTIHENHPEYDKSQGSEVNEKEKGRNQSNAC